MDHDDDQQEADDITLTSSVMLTLSGNEKSLDSFALFQVKELVYVMPRMWPGINKPGGVARVVKVHYIEG
jgi:hypothetical protein